MMTPLEKLIHQAESAIEHVERLGDAGRANHEADSLTLAKGQIYAILALAEAVNRAGDMIANVIAEGRGI